MNTRIRSPFHLVLASSLAILVFAAFSRTYYLKSWFATPPLSPLVHLHAATFSAWVALFCIQAWLVARHRVAVHRRLGIATAGLALAMVVIAVVTALEAGAGGAMRGGLTSRQHMAIPLTGVTLFCGFVGAGLLLRHRPALHRRCMLLGMLGVLGPAIGRLSPTLAAQIVVLCVALGAALAHDYVRERRVHPVLLVGGAALLASWPLRFMLAKSDAWAAICDWLLPGAIAMS